MCRRWTPIHSNENNICFVYLEVAAATLKNFFNVERDIKYFKIVPIFSSKNRHTSSDGVGSIKKGDKVKIIRYIQVNIILIGPRLRHKKNVSLRIIKKIVI
jgi:hypothetical protein